MEIYPQFKEKVQDGSVVHLEKFTVKNVRSYCPVNNKNKITFEKYTTMRNISDETSIPQQLFSFVDFKKLAPRDKQDEFLTDVIGFYNNISELQKNVHTRMGQSDKKSIYIDNERYKVRFEIEDSTCKKLITTFDDEAEYLLQRPLDELLKIEKQENGFDLVSEILEEPIGKEYEFEVKITKYNCENRKDSSLTVSKIDKIEKGINIIKQDDEEPNAKKQCVEIQD
ncbi:hypothetical protein IFM89_022088 [Coptis chinensis]|uniref:Replication factor A C-terminal domain-containing protein n=1 Tax=Coptis chinensis TaxID=261450 RepID=A0A835IC71_9MAGN|nr:hypothetical protein IFM89_022088 [Coptis chinensis]